ncbi:MAG TPA: gliding motility lipoprotein GldD [Bacteroidia bacterium]
MNPRIHVARFYASGLWLLSSVWLLSSCGSGDDIPIPKPTGYFRIDLPQKKYAVFSEAACPFEFEYPSNYSLVLPDSDKQAEPCWKNIIYPRFRAELNLSYKTIDKDNKLEKFLDDSWTLATRHEVKASGMPETPIIRDSARVFGLLFEIQGNAASSLQFYATDSTRHFIRGALYFYARPNYDSLSPVINFLKMDVERMITSLKWKGQSAPAALAKEKGK